MEETKKQKRRGIISGVIILIIILAIVVMSQLHFFNPVGQKTESFIGEKINYAWQGAINWFKTNIYPRVTQEVQNRGAPLQKEVVAQKDNAVQFIWQKIKNYFANIFLKSFGTKVE